MRRISGGAVWSNRPRTELARAPVEKSAGATLLRFVCIGDVDHHSCKIQLADALVFCVFGWFL